MGMTVEGWLDPICHESDWDDTRPWLRPRSAGQGPDGADDRAPVEETGRKQKRFAVDGRRLTSQ